MATSVTKGGTDKLPKHLRLSKPTDATIDNYHVNLPLVHNHPHHCDSDTSVNYSTHWKALEEHFLMVQLVFQFKLFRWELFTENRSP
jgi:hypothetical protein